MSKKPKAKPPRITDFSRALLEVVHNTGIDRSRIDRLEAMLKSLMEHLKITPVFEDAPEAEQQPFDPKDGVPDDGIVIPEGADRAGHWHAGCVHGFEWGHNCRCIPETIEYPNVACPRFCEGVARPITRTAVEAKADVH